MIPSYWLEYDLFLFEPDQEEVAEFKQFLPKVKQVGSWEELGNILYSGNI